jgi:hypothetical protein
MDNVESAFNQLEDGSGTGRVKNQQKIALH